ncbi:MAG: FG-GAP-like repeat-containing protein [Candidatus Falkowbacteria bacterium]|nr:FG-GAP-like repeat-containing protein [Candidatus Falkowbacteria bacterium]
MFLSYSDKFHQGDVLRFLCKLTAGLLVFLFLVAPLRFVLAEELIPLENIDKEILDSSKAHVDDSTSSAVIGSDKLEETTEGLDPKKSDAESKQNEVQTTVSDPKMPAENNLKKKPATPDEASGALIYSYPINIPPGRNGLQPDLSLVYNSQSRDLSSLFGQGWSLNIPYIERTNKKGVEKLYSDPTFSSSLSDELVLLGNNNYGSKVDNGEFLQYSFADSKWTATDKQGTKYTFGNTVAARQDDPADANKVYKWMLEEVRDVNNNFVRYEYFKDQGQIYPSKIFYSGNGSTDGIFEIDFLRENRADQMLSSRTGFSVKTNYRINNITTKVSSSWVKKYNLSYITSGNSTTSLLSSVTEQGNDGNNNIISLPPTSFEYQAAGTVHWEVDTSTWSSSSAIGEISGMVSDINGDGLDDIIQSYHTISPNGGNNTIVRNAYINNGQGQFIVNQNYEPPFDFTFTSGSQFEDYGARLADLNGDGLLDLVASGRSGTSKAYLNTGSGWQEATQWIPPIWFVYYQNDIGGQIANLNGDNLPDIIGSRWEWNGQIDVLITYAYINNGNGWARDNIWSLPIDMRHGSGAFFVDVNGDSLDDIVQSAWMGNGTMINRTFLNSGKGGWVETSGFIPPTYFFSMSYYGDVTDRGYRLFDVNGDGLVDILKSGIGAYLNNGNGWNTRDDSWNQPFELGGRWWGYSDPYTAYISNINGDGMPDIFRNKNINNQTIETTVVKNLDSKVNVLKKITYDTGGSTDISYKSTPLYRQNGNLLNPSLSMIIDTVSSVVTNDGSGNSSTANYSYEGGYYYYNSNSIYDYKFAGFSKVTKTDSLSKVISFYHQGNDSNSSQGEYQDYISKIGKMYRQEVYDLNNNLFSKMINKWDRFDLGSNRNFVKLVRAVQSTYNGNSSHKDSAEIYDYNNTNGNKTSVIQWGEVSSSDNGDFTDVGNDKYVTDISYAAGSANNVAALPSTQIVYDQNSNKVTEARSYYDNLPLGQVSLGNQTKQEQWVGASKYISTQKSYNSYGLVMTEIDSLGRQTNYTYDIYNLYPVTVINPANQISSFNYDYSSGKVVLSVDPNGKVFSTSYDALDRPTAELQPDQNIANLSVTKAAYEYTDLANANRIKKSDYLDANNAVDVYTYFDGLGRKVQERREVETSGQFSVRDFIYGPNDLLLKESLPYFSNNVARTPATTNQALYTTYTYDAMKRVLSAQTAVGTTSNIYDDWKTTVVDAKGKIKDLYKDAYDNLVQVNEHNGSEIYSTYYQWNGLKKLVKITDALGNVRNFSYDALGRVLEAQDLHASNDSTFGVWSYHYDDAGNLISKVAPNTKQIDYSYDDLNRVISEDAVGTVGVEVTYIYDNCQSGVGRLCSVINSTVKSSLTYNPLGQLIQESKRIGKVNYATQYNYDRQNNQTLIINPDDSRVVYNYNAAGLVDSVQRKESVDLGLTNVVTNIDYNPVGLATSMFYANGAVTTNTYDANELYRLRHKVTVANNQNVQDLTYTYDPVGNITQIVDASSTQTAKTTDYTYDDLHRLLSATISNSAAENVDGPDNQNQVQTFTYDAIGNITYKSDVGTYLYNGNIGNNYANPHAVTSAGNKYYSYDENGNVTDITSMTVVESTSYLWDYANRLNTVIINGKSSSYSYDASGQRIKEITPKSTTLYVTKDFSTGSVGNEKHIFLGDTAIASIKGSDNSAVAYNIHADHLTGSNVITDSAQSVDELTDYYSFGTIRLDQQNSAHSEKRKFTGHEYDVDTGLTYANARYYDARLGRWTSQDAVSLAVMDSKKIEQMTSKSYLAYLADVQGLNGYSYVKNNPLKYIDTTGDDWVDMVNTIDRYNPFTILFKSAYDQMYYGWVNKDIKQFAQGLGTVVVNGTMLAAGALEIGMAAGEAALLYQRFSQLKGIIDSEGFVVSARKINFAPAGGRSPINNLNEHWDKHRNEFPELGNALEYDQAAGSCVNNPGKNVLTRQLRDGRSSYYDQETNTLGIKQNGGPTTFMRPDPGQHKQKTNLDYFYSLR